MVGVETAILRPECLSAFVYILMTLSIAQVLRYLIRRTWTDVDDTTRVILHELVCTFERIAAAFETQIILGTAGVFWFLSCIVFLGVWFSFQWDPTKSSIPNHLNNIVEGNITFGRAVVQTLIEVTWGLLVYPLYVYPLWSLLDHQEIRSAKLHGVWKADININSISWQYAFAVEFLGSLGLQILGLTLPLVIKDILARSVIFMSAVACAVGLALYSSGGYFNPEMASIIQAGSEGATLAEHILIYWIASIAGTVVGLFLYRAVFRPEKEKSL